MKIVKLLSIAALACGFALTASAAGDYCSQGKHTSTPDGACYNIKDLPTYITGDKKYDKKGKAFDTAAAKCTGTENASKKALLEASAKTCNHTDDDGASENKKREYKATCREDYKALYGC